MINQARSRAAIVSMLVAVALLVLGTSALAAAGKSKGKPDGGPIFFAITHTSGGFEYSAGDGTDRILGPDAVTYKIKPLPTSTGAIKVAIPKTTVWVSNGTLSGTASATLNVTDAKGDATVSNGKFSLTRGTGGQKGHTYTGTFSGKGNVMSGVYAITIKGTYK